MNALAFLSLKGGGGKTTLASNLAAAYERTGHSTALIDLGPGKDLANWRGQSRDLPEIYDVETEALAEKLSAMSSRYDLVVIDTPPASEASVRSASQIADLVCLPVRVGRANVKAAAETIDLIRSDSTQKKEVAIRLLLTQRRPNTNYKATVESLRNLDVEALDLEMRMRAAYRRALNQRRSVFDLHDIDAAEEIVSIAYGFQRLLDGLPSVRECLSEVQLEKLFFRSAWSGNGISDVMDNLLRDN